jgi:exodeoxyribonuclease V alpha subunit
VSALADPYDVRRVLGAGGLLQTFNDAGVLSAADVHVATRLGELAGEPSEEVRVAVALAVRAPRHGHVFVDLATVRETAAVESDEPVDLTSLPWPEAPDWTPAVAASALVAVGEDDPALEEPLRLVGTRLYLDRYWRAERAVAADLNELAASRRLEVIVGGGCAAGRAPARGG